MPQKNKILNFLIKLRNKGSVNQTVNFASAKKIAILYEVANAAEFKLINTYIQRLNEESKQVFSLEFLPKKKDDGALLKEVNHYFFKEVDLNFLKLPGKKITEKFCNREFDILINLAPADNAYMHYIMAICSARLKIALYTESYDWLYDFLLDPGSQSGLNNIINSLDTYLRIINKN